MQRTTLAALAASVIALSSTTFVVAAPPSEDEAVPLPAVNRGAAASPHAPAGGARWRHGAAAWDRAAAPEVRATLRDLRALEHLYYLSGRGKDLPALYQELLSKATNPQLRDLLSLRLAQLQSLPANPDAAIATLRRSVDENLARANRTMQDE